MKRVEVYKEFTVKCSVADFIVRLVDLMQIYPNRHLMMELDGGDSRDDQWFPGFLCIYYDADEQRTIR